MADPVQFVLGQPSPAWLGQTMAATPDYPTDNNHHHMTALTHHGSVLDGRWGRETHGWP